MQAIYLEHSIPILALLLSLLIIRGRRRHLRLKSACEAAFSRVYATHPSPPSFEMSYSYGYPAFKITFESKLQLETATHTGINKEFKREINALCKGLGSKERPFTADSGVFFTYQGWLEEQLSRVKSEQSQMK